MSPTTTFFCLTLTLISNFFSVLGSQETQLIERQSPPSVVDFTTAPSCAQPGIFFGCDISYFTNDVSPGNYTYPTNVCPPVACPEGSPLSPSATGGELNCISTECFCSINSPLECAWDSCDWGPWFLVENWYNTICPNAVPLDFSGLPSCVQNCLPNQYIIFGCITQSRNCICNAYELFGCADGCDTAGNDTLNSWLSTQCGTEEDIAGPVSSAAASSSLTISATGTIMTSTSVTVSPTPTNSAKSAQRVTLRAPVHWYEIWAIVVICVTASALIIGWILYQTQLRQWNLKKQLGTNNPNTAQKSREN